MPPAPFPESVPLTFEQQQGKDLYGHCCAICHGDQGAGDGSNSYNLDPKPHSLADIINRGGRGVNMSPEMPAYGGTLSQLEIAYVTAYVRWLSSNPRAK